MSELSETNPANPSKSPSPRPKREKQVKREAQSTSKSDVVIKKLRSAKGCTIATLMEGTGWQAHSVRGFLSAVVKKKLGLNLQSETGKDGQRRYRVVEDNRADG